MLIATLCRVITSSGMLYTWTRFLGNQTSISERGWCWCRQGDRLCFCLWNGGCPGHLESPLARLSRQVAGEVYRQHLRLMICSKSGLYKYSYDDDLHTHTHTRTRITPNNYIHIIHACSLDQRWRWCDLKCTASRRIGGQESYVCKGCGLVEIFRAETRIPRTRASVFVNY